DRTRLEDVRDPEREAVDDRGRAVRHPGERALQRDRLLDRRPPRRPLRPVALDAVGHLGVERLARRDEPDRRTLPLGALEREARLAAARAPDQQGERHRRSGSTKTPSWSCTTRTFAP